MQTFDSLARTLVGPAPAKRHPVRRSRYQGSILAGILSLTFALVPLAVMTHVYMGAV